MPFTDNFILTAHEEQRGLVRVYMEPESEQPAQFAKALNDVLDSARWMSITNAELYKTGLPARITFSVSSTESLPKTHEAILLEAGFEVEKADRSWIQALPLSWDFDPRYRTLEEQLEEQIDQRLQTAQHNRYGAVAAHNAQTFQRIAHAVLGLNLNNTFESIKLIDSAITMERTDADAQDNWSFRVFSPATLIACGDYAAETAIRTMGGFFWGEDAQRPLVVGRNKGKDGATTDPRNKARKRCMYGSGDSVYSLLQVLADMQRSGKFDGA